MGKTIVYLKKSDKKDKKYMVYVDGKTIHFGYKGMSDYTKHKDFERMKRYENRHKSRENWNKSGIKTAGFWSKWILWNKPGFESSKRDTASRFNITFKKGWPTKMSMRKSRKPKMSMRKSRKPKMPMRKSRKPKMSMRKSHKPKMSMRKSRRSIQDGRKGGPKYERCVLAVKSKQPKHCMSGLKWFGGKNCYNPFAICTAKVGRNN